MYPGKPQHKRVSDGGRGRGTFTAESALAMNEMDGKHYNGSDSIIAAIFSESG